MRPQMISQLMVYYMEALDKKGQAKICWLPCYGLPVSHDDGEQGVIVTIGDVYQLAYRIFLQAGNYSSHTFSLPFVFSPGCRKKKKYSIFDLFKATLRFKALLTLTSVIAGIFFFRWAFSLNWFQEIKEQLPVINRISAAGWIGIALLFVLISTYAV